MRSSLGLIFCCWLIAYEEAAPSSSRTQAWFPQAPPLPAPQGDVIRIATVEGLFAAAESVKPGSTILVADGHYWLSRCLWLRTDHVTLRSESGDRTRVVLDGARCRDGELVALQACSGVTLADLTIQNVRHNGIKINSDSNVQRVSVYNCVLHNIWQRAVKSVKMPLDQLERLRPKDCRVQHCLFYNDRPKRLEDDPADTPEDFDGEAGVVDDMDGQRRRGPPVPGADEPIPAFTAPRRWEYSAPLIVPEARADDRSRAQKDPSLVHYDGWWHVFMTVKLPGRSAIEHCSFRSWDEANSSRRTILEVSDSDYYCAPQVFYFRPHSKWYLVYQVGVTGTDKMWVAYSTTTDITEPASWTRARPMLDGGKDDPRVVGGLDYWIICDDQRAYLFLTNLDGRMWRLWTLRQDFPRRFGHCELALEAKVFEASHTYRLKGTGQYLTVIEENGQRYYKAYLADRLDGAWVPVADTAERPFAGWLNVRPAPGVEPWTDNISHGELVRDGWDETLTVDPANLRFVFQGMREEDKSRMEYGQFGWRIGMLTPVPFGDVSE